MKLRWLTLALAGALSLAVAVPAPALAAAPTESIYTKVLNAYQAKGSLNPCEFTGPQLDAAMKALGTAGGQYFGDFIQAIQTALATRASGVCTANSHATRTTRSASAPAGSPGPTLDVTPLSSTTGAGVPAPLIAIAALAGALALLGVGTVLVRRGERGETRAPRPASAPADADLSD